MFFTVGILYDRLHTRNTFYMGGMVQKVPILAVFMFFFFLSNMSFPGIFNFIGEMMIFLSFLKMPVYIILFCLVGVIWSTCFNLFTVSRVLFGQMTPYGLSGKIVDLNIEEFFILVSIAFFVLVLGFVPTVLDNFYMGILTL